MISRQKNSICRITWSTYQTRSLASKTCTVGTSSMYHSVLRPLQRSLARTDKHSTMDHLDEGSPLYHAWKTFEATVEERLELKNLFDNGDSPPCSNKRVSRTRHGPRNILKIWQCHATCKSAKLGRCSACLVVIYCSKTCQKMDWPTHKAGCDVMTRRRRAGAVRTSESCKYKMY